MAKPKLNEARIRKEQVVNDESQVETNWYLYLPEYDQEVLILDKHIDKIVDTVIKLKKQ